METLQRPWKAQRFGPGDCPPSLWHWWFDPHNGCFQATPEVKKFNAETKVWTIEDYSIANPSTDTKKDWPVLDYAKVEEVFGYCEKYFVPLKAGIAHCLHELSDSYKLKLETCPDIYAWKATPVEGKAKMEADAERERKIQEGLKPTSSKAKPQTVG